MPDKKQNSVENQSEMQEIISTPPPWLIQWGMTVFIIIIMMIIAICAVIRYPDVVRTTLKINCKDAPKPIISKISGRLLKILVADKKYVNSGEALGFIESTGDHEKILETLVQLKLMQNTVLRKDGVSLGFINNPRTFELGELQGSYQDFYQSFLKYKSAIADGFFLKKRLFLEKDLDRILFQRKRLFYQLALYKKEYELSKEEYEVHKTLFEQKVESKMEMKREEAKFLASQHPLEETQSALLNNEITHSKKEEEIIEIDNQINEGKLSFLQAINNQLSEIELWKSEYVLIASQSGKVIFTEALQENQNLNANQEVFYIVPDNTEFYGVIPIPQYSMGKVKEGQEVLIKLRSFPFEEYGIIRGRIVSISDMPIRDSVFLSRVSLDIKTSNLKKAIHLKMGMVADAEIITEESSLLKRLLRSVIKAVE